MLSMIEMYIQGVSTRCVKHITETLYGTSVSKSLVSSLTRDLDETITKWRNRKLHGHYPYLVLDARYEDIRRDGVVMRQAVLVVVGISASGNREILSVDIGNSENEVEWSDVFKKLKSRGLPGVEYVVSDNHKGHVSALKREFQGIGWQRCQVQFMRNFISKFSRKQINDYVARLKDIFAAPDLKQARERKEQLVQEFEAIKPRVAEWLDDELDTCFTVYSLPSEHRKHMRSTNMLERFNQELLRRSQVVRIFPNAESCLRMFGAMSMEQSEQWQTGRQYLNMELIKPERFEEWSAMAQAV